MRALPFPCIRPVPEHAAEVAALPYDVFDRGEAAEYVEDRPLSFLNIDRPETQFPADQDMYAPEVYARGAELLHERLADGTFVEDRNLAYYIYRLAWEGHVQTGIVCVCAVDEFESGVIKRHELTREDKERDRIEHIEALGCQTGPIFLTYRDQPVLDMIVGAATTSTPLYDFADESGVRQTVWEVVRHDAVDALRAMLGTIPCAYIADGHHRAASAVKVARRMREEARAAGTYTGKEPFNYVLSVLFPASQLTILPYNRVVSDRNGLDTYELLEVLSGAGFGIVEAEGPVEPREGCTPTAPGTSCGRTTPTRGSMPRRMPATISTPRWDRPRMTSAAAVGRVKMTKWPPTQQTPLIAQSCRAASCLLFLESRTPAPIRASPSSAASAEPRSLSAKRAPRALRSRCARRASTSCSP